VKEGDLIGQRVRDGFRPSTVFLGEWRRKGLTPALQTALVFADTSGAPSPAFRGLWRQALPAARIPDVLLTSNGRATKDLVDVWEL